MSEASNRARGSIERRLIVQLAPRLVRGVETMSNCTLRQSGWRCSACATRVAISSSVAGVLAKNISKSIAHPLQFDAAPWRPASSGDSCGAMVNAALNGGPCRCRGHHPPRDVVAAILGDGARDECGHIGHVGDA